MELENSLSQNRLPWHPFRLLTAFAATFPKGTAELPPAKFAPEIPPQSLRDSSPKGTPFGAAAKFLIASETLAMVLTACALSVFASQIHLSQRERQEHCRKLPH